MQRRQFLERFIGVAGLTALGGCDSFVNEAADEVIGGKEAIEVLQNPSKVEAFRLKEGEYEETIDKYQKVGQAVPVDKTMAARLAELFSDSNSFDLSSFKTCSPTFGVQIRFARKDVTLDLLFCFDCDMFATYVNGKAAGVEDFDSIRPELVRIMKSLFPTDNVIQELTESGRRS